MLKQFAKAAQAILVLWLTLVGTVNANFCIFILCYMSYEQEKTAYCLCELMLALLCLMFPYWQLTIISLLLASRDVWITLKALLKK